MARSGSWADTNELIDALRGSPDQLARLTTLFDERRDGEVAKELGDVLSRRGRRMGSEEDLIASGRWYRMAQELYRWEEKRELAARLADRVERRLARRREGEREDDTGADALQRALASAPVGRPSGIAPPSAERLAEILGADRASFSPASRSPSPRRCGARPAGGGSMSRTPTARSPSSRG